MIQIIHADVIEGLRQIPDQTVQCVVTSPPYWGLRDYGVEGQIGLEKTPEEFIQKMVEVFREVKRVLRDDGTCWVNLGDGYNANTGAGFNGNKRLDDANRDTVMNRPGWLKHKDLVGMPWRVAFALQADGWYLRSDIIWSKPNPMPESVTDRPTKSHEYLFLLTKKPRYYYDADAVREAHKEPWRGHGEAERINYNTGGIIGRGRVGEYEDGIRQYNPAGRNRRTVWEIATQPFPMAHFATFPEALVEPCIKAGTSERGCCSVCGAPWVRVVEASEEYKKLLGSRIIDETYVGGTLARGKTFTSKTPKITSDYITIGWQPSCSCWEYVSDTGERNQLPVDTVPCVVLDPFGGSGTVGKVARDLNRKAILIELNAEYIKIAKERLRLNEQLGAFA